MIEAETEMKNVYQLPGTPIDKIRTLTELILDEEGTPYFMLIHQARTAEGIPEKSRQLVEQYSMQSFVDQLLPLFREGQQLGEIAAGDPSELIAVYLSVLSGLMVLNVQESGGYLIPKVEVLLRMVTGPQIR